MGSLLATLAGAPAPYTEFHLHPDIVVLVVALGGTYLWAVRRFGPRHAPRPDQPVSTFQATCFATGLISMWLVTSWPLHDLAENYLFSAHMSQHLVLMFITPPLLLIGTPGWLVRAALGHGAMFRIVRWVTRALPAFVIGTGMLVLVHAPPFIEIQVRWMLVHGLVHQLMLVAGIITWMPVLSPLPELPRLSRPTQLMYLFLQSVLPTVPGAFITFAEIPLFDHYKTTPSLWGWSALDDQQIAGLLMKVGLGLSLWVIITALFCAWQGDEERREHRARDGHLPDEWDAIERAFLGTTPTTREELATR